MINGLKPLSQKYSTIDVYYNFVPIIGRELIKMHEGKNHQDFKIGREKGGLLLGHSLIVIT